MCSSLIKTVHLLIILTAASYETNASGQSTQPADTPIDATHGVIWKNPLVKLGYLHSPIVETTPFVFRNHLYLAENYQAFVDTPKHRIGDDSANDAFRIRDLTSNEVISVAMKQHCFGTALVWNDRVYAFASRNIADQPWRTATQVSMTSTADLINWDPPREVLDCEPGEHVFNTAVCRGQGRFILLYENNDPKYPPFTFKYCESQDLIHWKRIPNALYGTDRYVGGPALYFERGWYYTLYLESLPSACYETRITRSRDLIHWQNAPAGRPFLTFDPNHGKLPFRPPQLPEKNASDAELCYFRGNTIVYFTGGDQQVCGDLQRAEFSGTPADLFEAFFVDAPEFPSSAASSTRP